MIRASLFAAALASFATSPALAGLAKVDTASAPKCEIQPINPANPVEWDDAKESMAELVASGDVDVRTAYRFKVCDREFTIYLLQSVTDRRKLYECSSDDTYRPVVACKKISAPARR